MADALSITFSQAWLNTLSNTAPTTYATVYINLHTGPPGTAGTSNISVGNATRQSATFGAATNISNTSTTQTTNTPQWVNGGTSETITDLSIWSAVSAGTFLFSCALSVSKPWVSGGTLQLASLAVSIPSAS